MAWTEIGSAGGGQHVELDTFPKYCPHCGLHVNAEDRMGSFFSHTRDASSPPENYLEVVFQCPSQECGRLFIGWYQAVSTTRGPYVFVKTIPGASLKKNFEAFIAQTSPTFCHIWNEAYEAEQAGLREICGMGFRKALEFLVKDYLCLRHPAEKDAIVSSSLANCIQSHIDDPKTKSCAKRAAWLGNDETHYLRKWEDKDLTDLKILIDLTVHWIMMEHLTTKYEDEMGEPNK